MYLVCVLLAVLQPGLHPSLDLLRLRVFGLVLLRPLVLNLLPH